MTSELKVPVAKERAFPWHCIECGKDEIFPLSTDYTSTELHDGKTYVIRIPDLEIPTCRNCGEQFITTKAETRIVAALRMLAGLLTPRDIEAIREELALSRQDMAEELGVTEDTLLGWESGSIIQSRAMDKLLRLRIQWRHLDHLVRQIDRFDSDFLEKSDAKLLDVRRNDSDAQYERLYALADGNRRFLVVDPSTGKPHALSVPCDIQTCYQAQMWISHGLDKIVIHRS